MGGVPQQPTLVADALEATQPEHYLPTISETNAFVDGAYRVWDLAQRWETDRSHSALTLTGATYRQALYLDVDAGTYYTSTNTLLGYPVIDSYVSNLPGAYLGLREDYTAGVEYAIGALYAAQIQTGVTYRTQMVIAPGNAITDTGVLLSSLGLRVCDSVLCVSWSDHYVLNPLGDIIELPGEDGVELRFWQAYLPVVRTQITR